MYAMKITDVKKLTDFFEKKCVNQNYGNNDRNMFEEKKLVIERSRNDMLNVWLRLRSATMDYAQPPWTALSHQELLSAIGECTWLPGILLEHRVLFNKVKCRVLV